MSVKPQNCSPVIMDKMAISPVVTFAATTGNGTAFFYDPDNVWQIVSAKAIITTAYIASNAAALKLGVPGTLTYFLNSVSLGASAIAVNSVVDLTSSLAKFVIPKATLLQAAWTQVAGQSGAATLWLKLRPQQSVHVGNKRPTQAQKIA